MRIQNAGAIHGISARVQGVRHQVQNALLIVHDQDFFRPSERRGMLTRFYTAAGGTWAGSTRATDWVHMGNDTVKTEPPSDRVARKYPRYVPG